MDSLIVATKTEDSNDSFPLVCTTNTDDSNDSISLLLAKSTADDETKVFLNIYDLNPINLFLGPIGFGLYHSGVEIDGCEYSFASRGKGIFNIAPKMAKGVRFCEQVEMGVLEHGEEEEGLLRDALEDLSSHYQPEHYDVVTCNCNHFCNDLLLRLLGKPLPGHVNRMSYFWTTGNIVWLVPKKIRKRAPVGDKNLKAYKGLLPFLGSILEISTLVVAEWIDVGSSLSDMVTTSKGLSILLEDQTMDTD